jgi:hypothetical protein
MLKLIATLRAAGLTDSQIVAQLEERGRRRTEQNRQAQKRSRGRIQQNIQQNQQSCQQCQHDIADTEKIPNKNNGHVIQNMITHDHSISSSLFPLVDSFPVPRARGAHPFPDDWVPKPEHETLAKKIGFDRSRFFVEVEKFKGHWGSSSKRRTDWDKAFRKWLCICVTPRYQRAR